MDKSPHADATRNADAASCVAGGCRAETRAKTDDGGSSTAGETSTGEPPSDMPPEPMCGDGIVDAREDCEPDDWQSHAPALLDDRIYAAVNRWRPLFAAVRRQALLFDAEERLVVADRLINGSREISRASSKYPCLRAQPR